MSLFHYVTYKYVIIKDKRLGVAYYALAAIIAFYTLVQLFVNKSYLKFDTSPSGNMRILVNTPVKLQNSENNYDVNPKYCCKGSDTNKQCIVCRKLDGMSLNWPAESRAVTIATFIKEKWEKQNCKEAIIYDPNKESTPFEVLRENDFYSLNPEFALLKLEHSITAFGGLFSQSHRKMSGSLLGYDGKIVKKLNSNDVSKVDKILLKDFLKAANVSLDGVSDALNAKDRTFRQNGLILHVTIHYENSESTWFGVGNPEYAYHVRQVAYSDYRLKQEIPIANNDGRVCERIVNKRYAVRLEFHQGGKIGQMSGSNIVLQLVSLMGLLTLTATIIDVIALYVIPSKDNYRRYVFDHSPEFEQAAEEKEEEQQHKSEENRIGDDKSEENKKDKKPKSE